MQVVQHWKSRQPKIITPENVAQAQLSSTENLDNLKSKHNYKTVAIELSSTENLDNLKSRYISALVPKWLSSTENLDNLKSGMLLLRS